MPPITVRLDNSNNLDVSPSTFNANAGNETIKWKNATASAQALDWFVISGLPADVFSDVEELIVQGAGNSVSTTDKNQTYEEIKYWVIAGKVIDGKLVIKVLDPRIRNDGSGGEGMVEQTSVAASDSGAAEDGGDTEGGAAPAEGDPEQAS